MPAANGHSSGERSARKPSDMTPWARSNERSQVREATEISPRLTPCLPMIDVVVARFLSVFVRYQMSVRWAADLARSTISSIIIGT